MGLLCPSVRLSGRFLCAAGLTLALLVTGRAGAEVDSATLVAWLDELVLASELASTIDAEQELTPLAWLEGDVDALAGRPPDDRPLRLDLRATRTELARLTASATSWLHELPCVVEDRVYEMIALGRQYDWSAGRCIEPEPRYVAVLPVASPQSFRLHG